MGERDISHYEDPAEATPNMGNPLNRSPVGWWSSCGLGLRDFAVTTKIPYACNVTVRDSLYYSATPSHRIDNVQSREFSGYARCQTSPSIQVVLRNIIVKYGNSQINAVLIETSSLGLSIIISIPRSHCRLLRRACAVLGQKRSPVSGHRSASNRCGGFLWWKVWWLREASQIGQMFIPLCEKVV